MAYGLEVKGPNGTSTVFSPARRFGNTKGVEVGALQAGQSDVISVPGASGTSSYTVLLIADPQGVMSVTKGTSSYTVTNTDTTPFEIATYVAMAILIG